MARGDTSLAGYDYDQWLASNRKETELRKRQVERRNANKGYEGYHFGIDTKPVYAKDKEDFRRKLAERGLVMRDDVRRKLK